MSNVHHWQQHRGPGKEVYNRDGREPAAHWRGLSVRLLDCASWSAIVRDLGGKTAILQGVGKIEAGSEQCKEPDDEKLLRADR
jgi:hypothetical protein